MQVKLNDVEVAGGEELSLGSLKVVGPSSPASGDVVGASSGLITGEEDVC